MRSRIARLLAALAVVVLGLVGVAGPAFAGTDPTIRSVDTTAFPKVKMTFQVPDTGAMGKPGVAITENGAPVKATSLTPIGTSGTPVGVALVIDTSADMHNGDRLTAVKKAAVDYLSKRQANEQVAVVAAGGTARVVARFSSDVKSLTNAINSLGAGGTVARWDAVKLATGLFTDHPELQANVVLISGGGDSNSTTSLTSVIGSVLSTRATVHSIAIGTAADNGSLQQLAGESGGQVLTAADANAVPDALAKAAHLVANQFVVTYTSSAKGIFDLGVSSGGPASVASVGPGTLVSGPALHPTVAPAPSNVPVVSGTSGKWVGTGLVLVAAGLAAFGILLLFVRDRADLSAALRPYAFQDEEQDEESSDVVLAETGFVRRAVDTTAKLADDRGLLEVVEQRLEQADLPLRAAEALFFWVAAVAILTALAFFVAGIMAAFAAMIVVGFAPMAVLNMLAAKRKAKFMAQLPDALQLLSSTLRSGYSLLQGVEAVSQEAPDPMGAELRRVMIEARLGRPIDESLQDAADRMGSADFDWAVMAMRIQREVGGNLAELLDTVGETMVQRERLRRDVKSLTAEGRMSAIVLVALPPGVGLMMYSLNPGYINTLFTDSMGKILLVAATGLAIGGFMWMRKMVQIES
jgi:tight adherence protein B